MANHETQQIDALIASRRALLLGGGAAVAALAMPNVAHAYTTPTSVSDNDILNFALNLEYLEANFYYYAAFGVPITTAGNASITAAGGANASSGIGNGSGTTATGGGAVTVKASPAVTFTNSATDQYIRAIATEIAVDEGRHVAFLRNTLGSAAVAQPAIDLQTSFNALASLAGIGAAFDPFSSPTNFLIGAFIFEDVGVTAYEGGAALIQSKTVLQAAAGILAVEAYHAGLIRSTVAYLDATNGTNLSALTQSIANLRNTASQALASTNNAINKPFDPNPDDIGVTTRTVTVPTGSVNSSTVADVDVTNAISAARGTAQIINIVTAGNAGNPGTAAKGGFFPNGLTGTIA